VPFDPLSDRSHNGAGTPSGCTSYSCDFPGVSSFGRNPRLQAGNPTGLLTFVGARDPCLPTNTPSVAEFLAASVFILLVLFAPTQLPSELPQSPFYDVLLLVNPVTSGLGYVSGQLVEGHGWTEDLSGLVSPLLTTVLAGGALILAGPRLVRLTAGVKAG